MKNKNVVAIVGAPNVGKSTLFNRIIGKRTSIVDNEPGVTRDRIYANTEWLTIPFSLIDTGGIELQKKQFQEEIRAQSEIAINEADVIVFLVDGKSGLNTDDKYIAKLLYKSKKPVILAVNKIDSNDQILNINEFYALGFGDPIPVSSEHGVGVGDLLDKVISYLNKDVKDEKLDETKIVFSIVGRPNVGKSSLANALIGDKRSIVSNIEGTTRDSINTEFERNGKKYCVIDTAGIKKSGKIYESVDKYALLRAMSGIDSSNIVLFVIDGSVGLLEQDKHVISYAHEQNKAIIIVVNKWDLVKKDQYTIDNFSKNLRDQLKFLTYAPIIYVSALTKLKLDSVFEKLELVDGAYKTKISTSLLNQVVQNAQLMNEAPDFNGGRVKIYFANQVSICPPTINLYCNNTKWMHFSYLRYIENRLRDSFNFEGTPINLVLKKKV